MAKTKLPTKLKTATDQITGNRIWLWGERGLKFRRVLGSFVMPFLRKDLGVAKGCALVLGEGLNPDMENGKRHIHILGEAYSEDTDDLLRLAAALAESHKVPRWIGNPEMGASYHLIAFNKQQMDLRGPRLYVQAPAMHDAHFRVLHEIAANRTTRNKTLFFNRAMVTQEYAALTTEQISKKVHEFPSVAALLWAVAEFDANVNTAAERVDYKPMSEKAGY